MARNALDGGQLIHLLDRVKLEDLRFPTYTFENTSQGKFMLTIMFGQSKYYVDSLSENVRRGNRTKREKGWLPGRAPIGYINARSEWGENVIAPDPERFPIVRRLWELFLSGAYSLPHLLGIASDRMGLRTPKTKRMGGTPLCTSGLYRLFSNPFYAGYMVHNGQWYQGKHEPVVSLDQFDRAQTMLGRNNRPRPKQHDFAYTGLIRCGTCGCSVTAEEKRNRYGSRYVYYHCTRKKRNSVTCIEKCAEEEDLNRQVLDFLERIYLDRDDLEEALEAVARASEKETEAEIKRSAEKALDSCRKSLENLTRLRCQESITEEEFARQRAAYQTEELRLRERAKQLEASEWIEPSRKLFLFSNRAKFWLTHGENHEKRLILSTVGSNLFLKGKKLNIDARKPFRMLSKRTSFLTWRAVVNDVRTFFETEPGFTIPELRPVEGLNT